MGEVAYEIELQESSRVHNVFHVLRLKKAIGQRIVPSADLPPLDEEGKLVLVLEAILDTRERRNTWLSGETCQRRMLLGKKSRYCSIKN